MARSLAKVVGFLMLAVILVIAAGMLVGMFAPPAIAHETPPTMVVNLLSALLLIATLAVLRLDGRTRDDIGLIADRRRFAELGAGLVLGAAAFAALSWALMLGGTIFWHATPDASQAAFVRGVVYFFGAALAEELIFRGYAFRRLCDAIGDTRAVIAMAVLFGVYHIVNVGSSASLQSGGWELLWRVAGPGVGGLLFGVAAVRTRGIALPFGLHFAGNVVQWQFLTLTPGKHPTAFWTPTMGPYAAPEIFQGGYLYLMLVLVIATLAFTRKRLPRVASRSSAGYV